MNSTHEVIVAKFGSSSVTNTAGMDEQRLDGYAAELAALKQQERKKLIVVSSGSFVTGVALWRAQFGERQQPTDRSLAMLGSGEAFTAWQRALGRRGLAAAQLLVTHREIDDQEEEGERMSQALRDNLAEDIVTVVNENDALSDEELRLLSYGGDNDGLASHIASRIGARQLMFLTDREGLLDMEDHVVRRVNERNAQWARSLAGEGRRGGMKTKVNACLEMMYSGGEAYIAQAGSNLREVVTGEQGTYFAAAAASVYTSLTEIAL